MQSVPVHSQKESLSSRANHALMPVMRRYSPRMRTIFIAAVVVATFLAIFTLWNMQQVVGVQKQTNSINTAYQMCQNAVDELQHTSDYLTGEAQGFVLDGDYSHLYGYLTELRQTNRRGRAIDTLSEHATSDEAVDALKLARQYSDELAEVELYALRLNAEALGMNNLPGALATVELSKADKSLSSADKAERAHELLFDNAYQEKKFDIRDQVQECSVLLVETLRTELNENNERLMLMTTLMRVNVILLVVVLLLVIGACVFLLLWPMSMYEKNIRENDSLQPAGAQELRYMVDAYNDMYAKNAAHTESLSYEAHNDALTGLLNRGAFNNLLTEHREGSALLLVDVDLFKHFNDDYGHDMGDAILVEVAATLYDSFRSTDYVCRIGGDEFAVIMTRVNPSLKKEIGYKIEKIQAFLRDTSNGLPPTTISVGVAFGEVGCTDDGLFQDADKALYLVKQRGRDGYGFADEVDEA